MPIVHEHIKSSVVDRVMNAVAAGTSDQNSSWVDTRGYDFVEFTALFGTLTATQVTTTKLQYSSDGTNSLGDVAGSATAALADGDSNKIVRSGIYKPVYQYVRMVIDRGTANAVIDGVLARLSGAFEVPVTQNADVAVAVKTLNAPGIGTA